MPKNPYLDSTCVDSAVLGDVDLLIDRFTLLTDSYRLLVGAAEELTRTPSATEYIIDAAMVRTGFLGKVLDQLLLVIQIALILDFIDIENNPYT
ncbi:MAG: hypothetical protein ACOCRZ_05950 [Halothermotrichaceae bacterium]